ncbi:MAG: hypothetical protein IKP47_04305, partial [Ruminococcus sp.]|nr:hypothetical protein [Ruminococcus sp.]
MKENSNQLTIWRIIAVVSLIALTVVCILFAAGVGRNSDEKSRSDVSAAEVSSAGDTSESTAAEASSS